MQEPELTTNLPIDLSDSSLLGRKRFDRIFRLICQSATVLACMVLVLMLAKLTLDGYGRIDLKFLTNLASNRASKAGLAVPIRGSLMIMGLTALIAVPLGVAAAIYLEEFNVRKNWFTNLIEINIGNLSGVPSIVFGLLGLTIFGVWLHLKGSILCGALTMTLLILPVVILVSQEAIRAVPKSYREGAIALGATRWQAIYKQVLPAAVPGILTGVILSMSRAIGETAPLMVVGAAAYVNSLPSDLTQDRYTVLPVQIYNWARRPEEAFHANAAGAILVLMVMLLGMNLVAILLRNRSLAKSKA